MEALKKKIAGLKAKLETETNMGRRLELLKALKAAQNKLIAQMDKAEAAADAKRAKEADSLLASRLEKLDAENARLLKALAAKLKAQAKAKARNWGDVGSLEKTNADLQDLIEFLGE